MISIVAQPEGRALPFPFLSVGVEFEKPTPGPKVHFPEAMGGYYPIEGEAVKSALLFLSP
jgi:hypothetical protein